MARNIQDYIQELRAQLAGADPAVVQDALYDAEEHLRDELAGLSPEEADTAFPGIVERYGTPEEIASAYVAAESMLARPVKKVSKAAEKPAWARFLGVVADPTAYGAIFYMLLALVTGILYFTVVVTGLSLSLGLAVLIIGLPVALLVLAIVRAISLAEGRVIEGLLGERMPRRPRLAPGANTGDNLLQRIKSWVSDYRTWTTMLYMLLQLPLGTAYFSVFVTAISVAGYLVVSPALQLVWKIPMFMNFDHGYYLQPWAMPFSVLLGALMFVVTLHFAKIVGRLHAAYAKVMLVGRFSEAPEGSVAAAPKASTWTQTTPTPPSGGTDSAQ